MQIQEKEYTHAGAIPASVRDEGGYRYWYEEDLEAIKAYASLPRKAKLKK